MDAVTIGWAEHAEQLRALLLMADHEEIYDGPRTDRGDERRREIARDFWDLLQPGQGLPC